MNVATCHTNGCRNAEIPISVDDDLAAGRVFCGGGCCQQITDITYVKETP